MVDRLGSCVNKRAKRQAMGLLFLLLLALTLSTRPTAAHGGVVIDSGFTPHVEWLVSIDPYPIRTGQALITLLVFDLADYKPVNDLKVQVAQAAPGTARPCCNPAELSDPITMVIDPALYPGDYSAVIPLEQAGEWALQFVVEGGERSFTIVVPLTVAASPPGQEAVVSLTPDVSATATVFAQNVQQARQQNSPLAGADSPLAGGVAMEAAEINTPGAANFFGLPWWLWGAAALIPLIMGWLLLRAPTGEALPTPDEEDDTETEAEDATADNASSAVDNRKDRKNKP